MASYKHRLDRFIQRRSAYSQADARVLIAQGRVLVDGISAQSVQQQITQFSHVVLDGECLQNQQSVYLMLHKPAGMVSATRDTQHKTVIDCLEHPQQHELHVVGRLDVNSTGLLLLTNDGAWSRRVSLPDSKLAKVYEVTLAQPLTNEYAPVFLAGIYFAYEGITTQPAQLEIITPTRARVTLTEGKYHQVKRMFGYFNNEVLSLHRVSVGAMQLGDLACGAYRELSLAEVALVGRHAACE